MNLFTECAKAESFLPFGSGSRACVGQKFAIIAISMLIASLLRNYEVRCNNCYALPFRDMYTHLLGDCELTC